nr:translation initiation factor IF-3 [Maritimibacter sp. DP1N21-5]
MTLGAPGFKSGRKARRNAVRLSHLPLEWARIALESLQAPAYFRSPKHPATTQRNSVIARRPHNAPPTRDTGPRINDRIRAPEIRLIGADGENVGVVSPQEAMRMAEEAGLDLVEISPNATPPVCKIMDFGKFKYEQQKRESEARKKQKIIEVKEVKFRPNTDTHDYDVKMRSVFKFLENGDKVKVTLRFRGREMAHQNLGRDLLERVAEDVKEIGKVENMPKLEGRQMVMMIGPVSK